MMNLLSIDWDYFFPDISEYDWQMNENNTLFYEFIWILRYSSRSLYSKRMAKNAFLPDNNLLRGFWEKALNNNVPPLLFLADSHMDISNAFEVFPEAKFNVWNFDQHHDMGYKNSNGKLNCGNWVHYFKNRIKQYTLIYPAWRMHKREKEKFNKSTNIHYSIPNDIPNFDILFICRSSPFTPSWSDHHWIKFIQYFKQFSDTWDFKIALPYILTARPFDKKAALSYEQQYIELTKSI